MRDQASLNAALDALALQDADVARGLEAVGYPEPRVKAHGFAPLIDAVVSQQISKEAAAAINARVAALMDGAVTPQRLLALDAEDLRGAGLSRPKVAYCRGVAEAVLDGRLPLDDLPGMEDEAVIRAITELRGFGRWSAEVYAMFALGRPDIFPADDMALQEALKRLKGLERRPKGKEARALVAHWTPYRSAGSIFLWRFYRGAPQ